MAGKFNTILLFKNNGPEFVADQVIVTNETRINEFSITEDFKKIVFGRLNQTVNVSTKVNSSYEKQFSFDLGVGIRSVKMDARGLYYNALASDQRIYTFYHCPDECSSCVFPNNCTVCQEGYILKGGYCYEKPIVRVQNIFLKGKVCQEYCHRKCRTCNQTRTDCYECAQFYKMEDGQCVEELVMDFIG